MDVWVCSFITACISALCWPWLPPWWSLAPLLCLSLVLLHYRWLALSGGLAGILWMASVGHWHFAWQLQPSQQGTIITVEGPIESLISGDGLTRFNLRVERIGTQSLRWRQPLVRLSWRAPDFTLKQGQRVRLPVRLKPVHGSLNEGGFNYPRWALSAGIRARGYVVAGQPTALLDDDRTFRQQLLDNLLALELDHRPWLAAFSLGYRGLLQQTDWALLQRTGVAHLVAISGLHLGIVGAIAYGLSAWLLGLVLAGSTQRLNLHQLALLLALGASLGYAAVAGFGLPTLRAWLMLALVTLLLVYRQSWSGGRMLLYCLLGFVLLFPLSLFGISLWLSFSAIVIIWLVFWRFPVSHARFDLASAGKSLLRIQLALSLLMLPLVAWQFSVISLISPLLNLLAVPVVTLILVPLCLVSLLGLMISPVLGQWGFALADQLLSWGIPFLMWAQDLPMAAVDLKQLPLAVWLLGAAGALVWFLPPLPGGRAWAGMLFIPLVSWWLPGTPAVWFVHVLDVGQGLAVVIQRQDRALIYDTGPAYGPGASAAQQHVLPFLQARGIREVDHLIISHHDQDHDGGLAPMLQALRINRLWTGRQRCEQGWQGTWRGLNLRVLWPLAGVDGEQNNHSCVLMIDDGQIRALLPGDIEAEAEQQLLQQYGPGLSAQILIAPHHGSRTSSSPAFIGAVEPQHVVFSQGFANRWQLPHAEVLARYQQQGSHTYQTSDTGQVSFAIANGHIRVRTFRQHLAPYWYMSSP